MLIMLIRANWLVELRRIEIGNRAIHMYVLLYSNQRSLSLKLVRRE